MKTYLILLISLVISYTSFSQKIAVIEYNNFSDFKIQNDELKVKYKYQIRELFEKKNNTWVAINNSTYEEKISNMKLKILYINPFANKDLIGIRTKRNLKRHNAEELFKIKNSKNIILNPLPDFILEGYEYQDILAAKIISDKKYNALSCLNTKIQLSQQQLNDVFDSLKSQVVKCGLSDDINQFPHLQVSNIEKNGTLLPDSNLLGRINLIPQNNCFTPGGNSAYGGGILHFIIFPNQNIKLLNSNTYLLEIADYDNDGTFEYLFIHSWFNNYGYLLFYDNFQKTQSVGWSYH